MASNVTFSYLFVFQDEGPKRRGGKRTEGWEWG